MLKGRVKQLLVPCGKSVFLLLQVAPHEGVELDESECRAYDVEVDEYHPKATRTLFIGNLEKDVTTEDLKKHFEQFGEIIVSGMASACGVI